MSSSPRRSTPDASFGDDPLASDQMQDIAISGDVAAAAAGDPASQVEQSGAFVVDKSALRRYNGWLALTVASSIGYAALVTENGSNETGRGLSFAALGLSLAVSLCVSGCFLAPDCNACTKAFLSPTSSVGRLLELGLVCQVYNLCNVLLVYDCCMHLILTFSWTLYFNSRHSSCLSCGA